MGPLIPVLAVGGAVYWLARSRRPAVPATPTQLGQSAASGAQSSVIAAAIAKLSGSSSSAGSSMSYSTLSSDQKANAALILSLFQNAGHSLRLGQAAVVNAAAESQLLATAIGDSGHSVGLFQLNDRGAGAGMSVADRQNPAMNTARILQVIGGVDGAALRELDDAGASLETLVRTFARDIERCSACGDGGSEQTRRVALISKLFP
jgi:hypothetical protein